MWTDDASAATAALVDPRIGEPHSGGKRAAAA
jgi:hypothetical protein